MYRSSLALVSVSWDSWKGILYMENLPDSPTPHATLFQDSLASFPLLFYGQHASRLVTISGTPAPSLHREKTSRHV